MMKKALLFLCLAAGLMSCAQEILNTEKETPQNKGVPMTFNVTVLETKAAKTGWVDGDKIYVFFNGLETKYLVMTYSTGTGWSDASGGGDLLDTDFSGLGTKKLTAVHFPVAVDVTFADGKFSFTSGGKPVYNYYLFETGKDYTVDGTTITATLSMGKPADMVQIHVAGIESSVADYTFGCSKIRPVACKSVGIDGTITEDVLQAGARLSGIADSDGGVFAGRLTSPGAAGNFIFTVASDDNIYTLTRTGKTLTAGTMYNFPALSVTGGTNWAVTDASDLYVDLGLSVKWAKCNLGATNPEDFGDYFAWGELQPKSDYQYSTYLYGSDYDQLTKYCDNASRGKDGYTDDLTVLEQSDDAAYAALGGQFRMPTQEEVYELCTIEYYHPGEYTVTWCDGTDVQYNGTSVQGLMIVRNSTGATLFLPITGSMSGTDRYYNGFGSYWSSSLYWNNPSTALKLQLRWDRSERSYKRVEAGRADGYSIRPVRE